jgi:hypothetical protein
VVYQHQLSAESDRDAEGVRRESKKRVFVYYSAADLPFTLRTIVEPLERRGHACVLQDRDFALGAAIQENIITAAYTCTRAVFVLSNHLARDDWFTFAFHVVFDRMQQSGDHRMALVTRDDLDVTLFVEEVLQVVKTSALLEEQDPWFAKRLRQFITCDGYEMP